MANDSLTVDTVASLLTQEVTLDVLQLTYSLPRNMAEYICDHDSVLIMIDDGGTNAAFRPAPWSGGHEGPLLLLKASLKAIHLDIYQGYQITHPRMERLAALVRDFSRSYLRTIHDQVVTWAA